MIELSGNIPQWIWQNLVPDAGQATSVQGELLRCVEKLLWEAQTNGNQNWDAGFEKLLAFVGQTLVGERRLAKSTKSAVKSALKRLSDYKHPVTEDQPFDVITAAIVDFCRLHPTIIERDPEPTLPR